MFIYPSRKTTLSNTKYKNLKAYAFFNVLNANCPHNIIHYIAAKYYIDFPEMFYFSSWNNLEIHSNRQITLCYNIFYLNIVLYDIYIEKDPTGPLDKLLEK